MFEDHHQAHEHDGNGHAHEEGHPHDDGMEAPLDAANQSLADALRVSFMALKVVMVFVLGWFLLSGFFTVDERHVAVVARFGKVTGDPRQPGLHPAWPYPIDEVIQVSTAPRTLLVEDFWLKLRDDEKVKPRELWTARGAGLDPAVEGALLTADKAIMPASFLVEYRVPAASANDYVSNVKDDQVFLQTVIKQAAVAEAARTLAETVWHDPRTLAAGVWARAQKQLNDLHSGIEITQLTAPQTHYPLQAAAEFLAVSNAENRKRELINAAESVRHNKLIGMAGPKWDEIHQEIEKLDQVKEDVEREAIIAKIGEILDTEATGEAGGKIKLAQRDREKIVDETLAEVSRFEALREQYHRNPELVRLRLGQQMRNELFANKDVVKWLLPPDDKQIVFWLNKDPKEIAEREKARMERVTQGK